MTRAESGRPRAVVCLSGGMDSCVCAALAARDYETYAVHFSYGQRTEARELKSAEAMARILGLREFLPLKIDLFRRIGGSALTDHGIAVPAASADESAIGSAIPVTYVPFRNAHFLSVAVSWAEAIGAGSIYIGAVAEDSSGYPDCRAQYYKVFQELIRVGTRPETEIEILTPVIAMKKSEIIKKGVALGAPLKLTWSCYQNADEACGVCDSCLLRLRAFKEAGMADPVAYRPSASVRA